MVVRAIVIAEIMYDGFFSGTNVRYNCDGSSGAMLFVYLFYSFSCVFTILYYIQFKISNVLYHLSLLHSMRLCKNVINTDK